MSTATAAVTLAPRLRWNWLWSARHDLAWNLAPFWLGLAGATFLYLARDAGAGGGAPWDFTLAGQKIGMSAVLLYLYGPLVDAPHLWATIARTYTDRDEWKTRSALFLGSLAWLLAGPAVILLPYVLHRLVGLPAGLETSGWLAFSYFLTFYALFHINRQHWGFVALYRRKNGEAADSIERNIDSWFFQLAIWLPVAAMLSAPWYVDLDGKPYLFLQTAVGSTTLSSLVHRSIHILFLSICAAYAFFQARQWRRGVERNGPKLVYIVTVISLYYFTFSFHPAVATLWVPLIGVGHCAQYHRVVWAYGRSRYAGKSASDRRAPSSIFENAWLYAALGVLFGAVTLQGPGAGPIGRAVARALDAGIFRHAFIFLGAGAGFALGVRVFGAFISGVRLHHFYVDSKIWRVSKSAALARNLDV